MDGKLNIKINIPMRKRRPAAPWAALECHQQIKEGDPSPLVSSALSRPGLPRQERIRHDRFSWTKSSEGPQKYLSNYNYQKLSEATASDTWRESERDGVV